MRLIFSLLIGLSISLSATAASKKKSKFGVKFLTYNQLVALPKAKRVGYIRDITKLMIMMEKYNSHYEVAGMTLQDLKEQFAMFEQAFAFMPEANAKSDNRSITASNATTGAIPVFDGEEYVCRNGYELNKSIPACLKVNSHGTTYYDTSEVSGCGEGMQEIPHPDIYFQGKGGKVVPSTIACMSKRNFALLDPRKQEAILEGKSPWISPNAFDRMTRSQQKEYLYGGNKNLAPNVDGTAIAGADGEGAPATGGGATAAPSTGTAAPAPGVATAPGATATPGATALPADKPVAGKPAEGAKPEIAKPEGTKPEATKPEEIKPETAAVDECLPPADTCEGAPDEEAIARFRKTPAYKGVDANKCIAGGFLSKYQTKTKQAGTCKPVTKFMTFPCDPGFVLCNPVLFCHTLKLKSGKPGRLVFCVNTKDANGKKDSNWTERCAKTYESRMDKTKLEDLFNDPKAKAEAIAKYAPGENKPQACDPESFAAGGQEEWNAGIAALKEMVDTWCNGTPDFKALFCKECQIVTAHVYKMNKKAVKSGCGPAESTSTEPADEAEEKPEGNAPKATR